MAAAAALAELLETERSYCATLDTIVQFIEPFPASREDKGVVFGNVDALRDFHTQLLGQLEQAAKEQGALNTRAVGRIFSQSGPFFRIYIEYCNNYHRSAVKLAALQKDASVQAFLHSQRTGKGLDLSALLITPVQRVPRYVLLFREVTKSVGDAAGKKEMSHALAAMESVASEINEAKRGSENVEQILQVQNRMDPSWGMVLLQPTRHFLAEVPHCTVGTRTAISMFVFNDLLLLAEDEERADRFVGLVLLLPSLAFVSLFLLSLLLCFLLSPSFLS
jgi:hypothetical protein